MMVLAQEGDKVYEDTFDLLYKREAKYSNETWQADHTLLDIYLIDNSGQQIRPWLTVVIDDYSRAIAGYYLFLTSPSAIQTALALRQAIWNKSETQWQICGIPERLYTDHGSDFTSKHIEMVCANLKIQLIFSNVGKPRGRGKIERFFNTINQRLLCQLPGYIIKGHNSKPVLTLSQFEIRLKEFLLKCYHQEVHSITKESPINRWGNNGFLPHLHESLAKLDLLLLTVAKPRKVHQDGIYFQSLRYLDPILAAYIGESIVISYDPRDIAEIRDFYDQKDCGLILIGMPGMEKKLSRYAQLYSRIGFVHEFKPLSQEEMLFIMSNYLAKLSGIKFGRKRFINRSKLLELRLSSTRATVIAKEMGISRAAIYKILKEEPQ